MHIREAAGQELEEAEKLVAESYALRNYLPQQDSAGAVVRRLKQYKEKTSTLVAIDSNYVVGTITLGYGKPLLIENLFGVAGDGRRSFDEQGFDMPCGTSAPGHPHELRQALAMLDRYSSDTLLVCTRLATRNEYWGKGCVRLGMLLIREVARRARAHGTRISAFVVHPHHVKFYKRFCGADAIAEINNVGSLAEGKAPGVLMWLSVEDVVKKINQCWPELDRKQQ